ncbi:ligase-associated DNA damage response exonuclease [Legionella sp. MW5194]|uniref:ligase-associated DNA damage response exonuclease n=1 Tax=Legionella sp. MW5194 TaxID=2662448 RepID=UPI00193E4FF5|nr:ligase-associated DNA damage response exonuclease [Legionella sp. MW5194]QRN04079.1 ligase-associated DNA damage response exonuclease [Legionella sp. MW5194]
MNHSTPWLVVKEAGLYCEPGEFYIDPVTAVPAAVITHAHGDHACAGHGEVFAHTVTLQLMQRRFGEEGARHWHPLAYQQPLSVNAIDLYLLPAGHILGSAQLVMDYQGSKVIFSGDYKRRPDPTCDPFLVEHCDVSITEATFALPVFNHPPIEDELQKLLRSLRLFPHRCHLVGVYVLGKCQRVLRTLRLMGYLEPIYIHGSLQKTCEFYQQCGIDLGELRSAIELTKDESAGKIVLCPPSALRDRWSRRFANVLIGMASGWMQIRARAKQQGVELPLIISDHADWPELIQTLSDVNPNEIFVTHGREEALIHYAQQQGYKAQALHLLGYDEQGD